MYLQSSLNRSRTHPCYAHQAIKYRQRSLRSPKGCSSEPGTTPEFLVDKVIELIINTDGGQSISPDGRIEVDSCLSELERFGRDQKPRPLENPKVFGNYNVAYVSTGNRQYGQPAGGRFRTGAARILFRTTGLFQSLLHPDVVINKVAFRLFGIISGFVGLRGKLVSIPEEEGGINHLDTVKVFFSPPELVFSLFGSSFVFKIGPPSTVVLKTTYLDDRVRIGKGSRGSLFVFTRGEAADEAAMEVVGLQKTSMFGMGLIVVLVAFFLINGGFLLTRMNAPLPLRAAGGISLVVGFALAATFYKGGIVEEGGERPEVAAPSVA